MHRIEKEYSLGWERGTARKQCYVQVCLGSLLWVAYNRQIGSSSRFFKTMKCPRLLHIQPCEQAFALEYRHFTIFCGNTFFKCIYVEAFSLSGAYTPGVLAAVFIFSRVILFKIRKKGTFFGFSFGRIFFFHRTWKNAPQFVT